MICRASSTLQLVAHANVQNGHLEPQGQARTVKILRLGVPTLVQPAASVVGDLRAKDVCEAGLR